MRHGATALRCLRTRLIARRLLKFFRAQFATRQPTGTHLGKIGWPSGRTTSLLERTFMLDHAHVSVRSGDGVWGAIASDGCSFSDLCGIDTNMDDAGELFGKHFTASTSAAGPHAWDV
jgi:hypothetical protein